VCGRPSLIHRAFLPLAAAPDRRRVRGGRGGREISSGTGVRAPFPARVLPVASAPSAPSPRGLDAGKRAVVLRVGGPQRAKPPPSCPHRPWSRHRSRHPPPTRPGWLVTHIRGYCAPHIRGQLCATERPGHTRPQTSLQGSHGHRGGCRHGACSHRPTAPRHSRSATLQHCGRARRGIKPAAADPPHHSVERHSPITVLRHPSPPPSTTAPFPRPSPGTPFTPHLPPTCIPPPPGSTPPPPHRSTSAIPHFPRKSFSCSHLCKFP